MIKFVATDLDGTLLTEDKRLPGGIFALIERLDALGILFAPASGRQYANLEKLFQPVKDKVVFLCENGALVKYRGQTLSLNPVPPEAALRALSLIRGIEDAYPVLCGMNGAYIENDEEPFLHCTLRSYDCCKRVERLEIALEKEPICKLAVYCLPAEKCAGALAKALPELRVMISGAEWCDISAVGANKGAAMRLLRKKLSLKREECVGFGDHMNDLELLLECGFPFVTENAYPPLKERFPVIGSNEEGGVLKKIEEIIAKGGCL